eukprot:Skav224822  [mRNA]  locus=scaffold613:200563:200991:- [translate_table: standard]
MYTQVSAGGDHTVLLRSDGAAVACGHNKLNQCDLPTFLLSGPHFSTLRYIAGLPERILQLDFQPEGDAMILRCVTIDGAEVACLRMRGSDLAVDALRQLTCKRKASREQHRVVLPDGQMLDTLCSADPFITLATMHSEHDKP